MAQMTERMKELFNKVPVVVLSTATADGIPNAVPVGAKKSLMMRPSLCLISFLIKPWPI